jgi:hypothetical protein
VSHWFVVVGTHYSLNNEQSNNLTDKSVYFINKSLLGKAPPYLNSLVTILTRTRSARSSGYIALVNPKANTSFGSLSFQFSAANDWNEVQKLESYISLTSFKHQLSEQITDHCTYTQPICK